MKTSAATAILSSLLGLTLANFASAGVIVSDPVENNGTWTVTGNPTPFLTGTVAGISPTAETDVIHVQNVGGRLATKSFTGITLAPGTYTISFDIGNYNNAPFANFDISLTGLTVNGTVLTPSASSSATPASGAILSWTRTYNITPVDANLGATVGFQLSAPNTGATQNASFDNLVIAYVPEPTTGFLLGTGAIFLGAIALRRRRRQIS